MTTPAPRPVPEVHEEGVSFVSHPDGGAMSVSPERAELSAILTQVVASSMGDDAAHCDASDHVAYAGTVFAFCKSTAMSSHFNSRNQDVRASSPGSY